MKNTLPETRKFTSPHSQTVICGIAWREIYLANLQQPAAVGYKRAEVSVIINASTIAKKTQNMTN